MSANELVERTIDRVWDRFLAAWQASYGEDFSQRCSFPGTNTKAMMMAHQFRLTPLPGFHFENYFEAACVGVDCLNLPLTTPEPTAALPGSPERTAELAARYASGHELWHERDAMWDLD